MMDKADKGLSGLSFTSQLVNVQSQGPLPYTTYDLLKHWSWMISLIKFLAHIFSLPLMVFLRRDFGMRYVDDIHIAASFIVWQVVGLFSAAAGGLVSDDASPWIALWAWAFLPVAFYRRYRARQATLRLAAYSYYPGTPMLAPVVLGITSRIFRRIDGFLGDRFHLPRYLTHPADAVNAGVAESYVRRFIEPVVVVLIGLACGTVGMGWGFATFLFWTALLLHADETLAQRAAWELFIDMVDAQVVAQEKQYVLSGEATRPEAKGFSVASLARLPGSPIAPPPAADKPATCTRRKHP